MGTQDGRTARWSPLLPRPGDSDQLLAAKADRLRAMLQAHHDALHASTAGRAAPEAGSSDKRRTPRRPLSVLQHAGSPREQGSLGPPVVSGCVQSEAVLAGDSGGSPLADEAGGSLQGMPLEAEAEAGGPPPRPAFAEPVPDSSTPPAATRTGGSPVASPPWTAAARTAAGVQSQVADSPADAGTVAVGATSDPRQSHRPSPATAPRARSRPGSASMAVGATPSCTTAASSPAVLPTQDDSWAAPASVGAYYGDTPATRRVDRVRPSPVPSPPSSRVRRRLSVPLPPSEGEAEAEAGLEDVHPHAVSYEAALEGAGLVSPRVPDTARVSGDEGAPVLRHAGAGCGPPSKGDATIVTTQHDVETRNPAFSSPAKTLATSCSPLPATTPASFGGLQLILTAPIADVALSPCGRLAAVRLVGGVEAWALPLPNDGSPPARLASMSWGSLGSGGALAALGGWDGGGLVLAAGVALPAEATPGSAAATPCTAMPAATPCSSLPASTPCSASPPATPCSVLVACVSALAPLATAALATPFRARCLAVVVGGSGPATASSTTALVCVAGDGPAVCVFDVAAVRGAARPGACAGVATPACTLPPAALRRAAFPDLVALHATPGSSLLAGASSAGAVAVWDVGARVLLAAVADPALCVGRVALVAPFGFTGAALVLVARPPGGRRAAAAAVLAPGSLAAAWLGRVGGNLGGPTPHDPAPRDPAPPDAEADALVTAFTPGGGCVALALVRGRLRAWDVATGAPLFAWEPGLGCCWEGDAGPAGAAPQAAAVSATEAAPPLAAAVLAGGWLRALVCRAPTTLAVLDAALPGLPGGGVG